MQPSQTYSDQLSQPMVSKRKQAYEKLLLYAYESIKEKESFLKRAHAAGVFAEIPKSLPKLPKKDFLFKNVFLVQERNQKILATIDCREEYARDSKKNMIKTFEQQQIQISKENMNLLGLNIQRVNYIPKGNKMNPQEGEVPVESKSRTFERGRRSLKRMKVNVEELTFNESYQQDKMFIGNPKRVKSSIKWAGLARMRERTTASIMEKKRKTVNVDYSNAVYEARIDSYRDFLFKLNYTYGVFVDMEKLEDLNTTGVLKVQQKYKAWVGTGNNGNLVKGLLRRRYWWCIIEDKNYRANFIWTQIKNVDYFKNQPSAESLSARKCCKTEKEGRKDIQKTQDENGVSKQLRRNKNFEKIMNSQQIEQYEQWHSKNRSRSLQQKKVAFNLRQVSCQNVRVHNHLPNNFHLGNKKALLYNLKQYYKMTGGTLFQAIPLTFHIKRGFKDPQYKRFVQFYRKRDNDIRRREKKGERAGQEKTMQNSWIVKPGELTNRGNGITVIGEIAQLDKILKAQCKHNDGSSKTFIVQLYIDRPFLYRKRKFDIRHYILISQLHGNLKVYWYQQGYLRTTSYEFDLTNFDREVHLTNDAVQKNTPLYGKYEQANKISYGQFQKYLDTTYPREKYNFKEQIIPRMREISLNAVKSTLLKLSPDRLQHNFEIFGLDFMIDEEFKPWLIEINTNPCLELVCPLLSRMIPQMLDQALRLTLDVIYPPPCHYTNNNKHLVPDASLENLKFSLIFDEKVDGEHLRNLYLNSKGNMLEDIGQMSDDQIYDDQGKDIPLDDLL